MQHRLHVLELVAHALDAALGLRDLALRRCKLVFPGAKLARLDERLVQHPDDGRDVVGAPDALGERAETFAIGAERWNGFGGAGCRLGRCTP